MSLVRVTYFRNTPVAEVTITEVGVGLFFSCFISFCHFKILYGRPKWVWGMVILFVVCLLMSLPTIYFSPHLFFYFESLFWPLLGLYLINSKRYREMRAKFVELRRKRERVQAIGRARRKRNG